MYAVGVRELKIKLSQYLHQVREGRKLIVTDRGKPIATISPLDEESATSDPEVRLARLAGEGIIRPARTRFSKITRIPLEGPSVSGAVIEDRSDLP